MRIQYRNSKNTFTSKFKIESKSTIKVEEDYKAESHRCLVKYQVSLQSKSGQNTLLAFFEFLIFLSCGIISIIVLIH